MKRTQIQLDEPTWEALRTRSFEERRSIAEMIREMVRSNIGCVQPAKNKYSLKNFSFIGSGKSRGKGAGTIGARHDEELGESFAH